MELQKRLPDTDDGKTAAMQAGLRNLGAWYGWAQTIGYHGPANDETTPTAEVQAAADQMVEGIVQIWKVPYAAYGTRRLRGRQGARKEGRGTRADERGAGSVGGGATAMSPRPHVRTSAPFAPTPTPPP